jgi:glycosyltransferase involved in cell wall biosynthesis
MKIVIVSEGPVYPATAGNRIRTLNLMLRLAGHHQITCICRAGYDPDETRRSEAYLNEHGIRTLTVNDTPIAKRGARFYGRLAANLLSPLPYAVSSHNSLSMRETIRVFARDNAVDLWQFEWLAYADALEGAWSAPRIVMAHNVESLIWQRYVEVEKRPLHRWYLRRQLDKYRRFERRIFAQCNRVVTVSLNDAVLVREQFGIRHVTVVDNGIDREYFQQAAAPRQPRQILFLGSLDWRPNLDAVRILLDQVFPKVLARMPEARLCVVGRHAPPWLVQRIRSLRQVTLHSDVPDVRPFLAESGVMAVPLRIGGGSRLKILEALACGLPVVSTSVGCEGLRLDAGIDLLVTDTIEEMAAGLIECLDKPQWAGEIAQRGRGWVLRHYDWKVLAGRLERIWLECHQEHLARRGIAAVA